MDALLPRANAPCSDTSIPVYCQLKKISHDIILIP